MTQNRNYSLVMYERKINFSAGYEILLLLTLWLDFRLQGFTSSIESWIFYIVRLIFGISLYTTVWDFCLPVVANPSSLIRVSILQFRILSKCKLPYEQFYTWVFSINPLHSEKYCECVSHYK